MTCACGAESRRGTVFFDEHGNVRDSHCATCRPELYAGPRRDPSDQKIWIGPEYLPNRYRLTEDALGPIWMPTDEQRQDDHDAVCQPSSEAQQAALTSRELEVRKRATRRTQPMTSEEQTQALAKAREIAEEVERYHANIQ